MKEDGWGKCVGFWSPFGSDELKAIRDRALYFVNDANPDDSAALRKIAQGCDELLAVIAKWDKRMKEHIEAQTGRKLNIVTGYVE